MIRNSRVNRNDLVFLALMTALAAIATAPPLPRPPLRWEVADAGLAARSDQVIDDATAHGLASVP